MKKDKRQCCEHNPRQATSFHRADLGAGLCSNCYGLITRHLASCRSSGLLGMARCTSRMKVKLPGIDRDMSVICPSCSSQLQLTGGPSWLPVLPRRYSVGRKMRRHRNPTDAFQYQLDGNCDCARVASLSPGSNGPASLALQVHATAPGGIGLLPDADVPVSIVIALTEEGWSGKSGRTSCS